MGISIGRMVEKVSDAIKEHHIKKENKYIEKRSGNIILFVRKTSKNRNVFRVYDQNDIFLYRLNGGLFGNRKRIHFKITDGSKKRIGEVKQSLIAKLRLMFHEDSPADYEIIINGTCAATLKTIIPYKRIGYEVVPQGWKIKSSILKFELTMYDSDENEIAHVSERSGYNQTTYILYYLPNLDARIMLAIMMTLMCREKYLSEHINDRISRSDFGDYDDF